MLLLETLQVWKAVYCDLDICNILLNAHRRELHKAAAGPNPDCIGVKLPDHERDHKLLRFAPVRFPLCHLLVCYYWLSPN